jgi:hypothetical protein
MKEVTAFLRAAASFFAAFGFALCATILAVLLLK